MKKSTKSCEENGGKRGVAILIVIAMLSTLMMAASAFSISMRLERKGAANYRHSVMSRHLLSGALTMALRDIDESMDPNVNSGSTKDFLASPPTNNILGWSKNGIAFWSDEPPLGKCDEDQGNVYARATTPDAPYYVPSSIRDEVFFDAHVKPEWLPVKNSSGEQIGRCSYLVANVSGLLDANIIGGTNRTAGASAYEIQLENPTLADERNKDHKRYESLRELSRLNPPLYDELAANASTFSCSKEGWRMSTSPKIDPNTMSEQIYIGGTIAELQSPVLRNDIKGVAGKSGLGNCGITELEFVYQSMLDYIDEDCLPRLGTSSPNTESITMLNEVNFQFGVNPANNIFQAQIYLEFIYPYLNTRDNAFNYSSTVEMTYLIDGDSYDVTFKKDDNVGYVANTDKATSAKIPYYSGKDGGLFERTVTASNLVDIVSCHVEVVVKAGGVNVDKVTLDLDKAQLTAGTSLPISASANPVALQTWECIDPRYNWEQDKMWVAFGTGTMGSENAITAAALPTSTAFDDDTRRYCADTGQLRNVGELGNLPVSQSFVNGALQTLKTCGTSVVAKNHSKIFEEFTTSDRFRRGLVSINSKNIKVWQALFRRAPLGAPEDPASMVNNTQALGLAGDCIDAIYDYGPFYNVSDFVRHPDVDIEGLIDSRIAGLSDVEREMLVSATAGLLTARQNTFLIFLSAEKFVEASLGGAGGKSMASSYALAVVSRDPYRDPDSGQHEMFVRSFKMLAQ